MQLRDLIRSNMGTQVCFTPGLGVVTCMYVWYSYSVVTFTSQATTSRTATTLRTSMTSRTALEAVSYTHLTLPTIYSV